MTPKNEHFQIRVDKNGMIKFLKCGKDFEVSINGFKYRDSVLAQKWLYSVFNQITLIYLSEYFYATFDAFYLIAMIIFIPNRLHNSE